MSNDIVTRLKAVFDGSEASKGMADMATTAERAGRRIRDASGTSATGLQRIKDASAGVARGMDADEKRMASSMQKLAISMAAGADAAKKFEMQMAFRGMDPQKFQPYLQGLREIQQEQEKATQSAKKMSESMRSMANGLGALAAGFLSGSFMNKFITETIAAEQEQSQLAAVIRSTGASAGWAQGQLNDMATAMAESSNFSAGEINKAQTRLLAYTGIVGKAVPETLRAILDMSARTGQSVEQSAEMLGKAINLPSDGMTSLRKMGFEFGKEQIALAEKLEASGKLYEAQKIVLDELKTSYGGAAEAARDTLGGAMQAVKKDFDSLMTGEGGTVTGLRDAFESLHQTMSSESTKAGFQTVLAGIAGVIEMAVKGISVIGQFANAVSLNGKVAQHGGFERQFDFAKGQYERLQPRLRLDPNNAALQAEAQGYRDAMARAHKAMQEVTASMQAPPPVEIPTVDIKYPTIPSGGGKSGSGKRDSSIGAQENAIAAIKARIAAEEELANRLELYGAKADELSEGDKLVIKLKKEIAESTDGATRAAKEAQLVYALQLQAIQNANSETQKQIKAQAEAEASYRKYIDGINKSADSMGDMADKQEAANATFGKSKVAIAEMAMEQAKLAAANAKDMGPWTPEEIAALQKLASEHERYVASLKEGAYIEASRKYDEQIQAARDELELQKYGMSLLGVEESQRQKLIAARKTELALAKEIADIEKKSYSNDPVEDAKRKADLIAQARLNAETKLQTELAQIQDQAITEQVQKYDQIFSQGFADMLNNGKDGWKSFTKSLTTTFKTQVADQLYKMFVRPIVVNLVAAFSGGGGWIDSLLGMVGLGGGKGGASSIFGMASNANTAYNIYSGQGVAGQAWNWGKGVLGYGGTVPWSAAGAQASGAVTYPVGGSVGAAAPGQGGWMSGGAEWLASGGWVMAVPMIAAYLGGMFKEEKMVGTGLTGELGGDMYGYQLMRESGSWFDGPDYRYVVAEKRIKESKEEIERLKKEIAAAPEGENVSGKQVRMQRLYAEIERLEELYNGAIEGSKGPIKILQDAYAGMREDTASRADTLGLDGDAIRKMKVALGLDEIHPDTGGMGIELTGLSQEEASKKIQQALEQANEEMARSVLGTWETVTHDVTRTIFENVWVTDESDAGGHWQRTAKEVTESLTEQVFVMSEYVREGETAVQALTRLSDSLVGVNSVFDLLGATLLEGSLASADWASSLIEAVGSMDALAEATSTYFDLYYSDDEKRDRAVKNANKGMEDKGFDLRTNDADAKRKYRDLVDKAIADKDEELLAWLLKFADDFSNGVDAVNAAIEAKTAELQQVRDKTMGALGLSVDGLVDGFIKEINEGRGATAGTWLADQIVGGFEQAIYEQAITSIINSMIDGMITPMLTAALTGASISEIVSQAAIDQMIASASAAVEVLNTLLNSEDFQKGMEKLSETIASIGNTAGRAIPAMRSYQKQMASTGWAVGSDGVIYNAAEKAAEEAFQGIFDAAKTALDGAVGREKEYWQKFVDNAQESLDKAASFFDLVTDAAKGLRDSLEDVSTMQAAAGMVFLESALEQARQGKGLSDYDKTQSAIEAATGAMVMDNFASQAELNFEKKRLAGQLDELGVFADKQKTDAERLIEQGNAEIDRLDKLLEYWQNYGQASVDATLSVADAVKELEKQASSALGQKMLGVTYDGKGSLASFDVGTNYVPSDMTARVHKGERIIPAADNRALMAALQSPSAGNAELVAELRAVKAELAEIKQHTAGTQEYSRRIDGNINQVTEGGNAMRMVSMD